MATTVKCLNCSRLFKKTPSWAKRTKNHFCCYQCYWKFIKGKRCNSGKTLFKKGNIPLSPFVKGQIAWNKGKNNTWNMGELNKNWKGGITSKNKIERSLFRQSMQKQIFERDNFTCQMCGARGVNLQVDHIQSWAEYVDLRFDINNCRTLCNKCHYKITFGREMPQEIISWGQNYKQIMGVKND